jgi:hypothetical protein
VLSCTYHFDKPFGLDRSGFNEEKSQSSMETIVQLEDFLAASLLRNDMRRNRCLRGVYCIIV